MEVLIRWIARGFGANEWADFQDAKAAYEAEDYVKALGRFQPMAEAGNLDAQFWLGAMYRLGQGVSEDLAEAMKWYRRAAERGHGKAQGALGAMYVEGGEVPKDHVQAFFWLALSDASDAGWDDAGLTKSMVMRKMTPEEIEEAERLVTEFKAKAES